MAPKLTSIGLSTSLGPIRIDAAGGAICSLDWCEGPAESDDPLLQDAAVQLTEYFAGGRRDFDLPLAPEVSVFQKAFGEVLRAIPFGHTRTYGEIAHQMGCPAQSIGQACGANPIPILIPCHRVLGATNLGGFSARGGVEAKVALLRHEGAASLLI